MYASVTVGHATVELRNTRNIGDGEERRTIRVRPARTNTRRAAINDSWTGR